MATRYHTSIDCCEKAVACMNHGPMENHKPQKGDIVVIYSNPEKHIEMEVAYRVWDLDGNLYIELMRTSVWRPRTLTEFEEFVKKILLQNNNHECSK